MHIRYADLLIVQSGTSRDPTEQQRNTRSCGEIWKQNCCAVPPLQENDQKWNIIVAVMQEMSSVLMKTNLENLLTGW